MSRENVEVVCDLFAATNERDFPRAMSHYAEDVVLVADAFPERGTFKGSHAVGQWFANWLGAFEPGYHFDIEEARDLGDVVFLFATCYGRGRTSGVEVHGQTGFLYTLRSGKIARVELYPSRAEALEAAGLSESAMSQPPVDALRLFYVAASRDDLDALSELVAPDVELIPPNRSPDSAPVKGMQEVQAWWTDQRETVGNLSIEVEKLIEAEEFIVALIRLRIRPHGADADFELRIAHLWTLRDGKLIRCEIFPERDKALEAAGLRE